MALDELIIRKRLGFIKYLYSIGVTQSRNPDPICALAVLSFQDAIEMFLRLAIEHLDVHLTQKEESLHDQWSKIDEKLKSSNIDPLFYKQQIFRLNKARIELKHRGTRPSKSDVEEFRSIARRFFADHTDRLFSLNFESISLIDLVTFERTRHFLEKSQTHLSNNEYEDAINNASRAFSCLIRDYMNDHRVNSRNSMFSLLEEVERSESRHGFDKDNLLIEFDTIHKSLKNLEYIIMLIGFGIDFRRFITFESLVPNFEIEPDLNVIFSSAFCNNETDEQKRDIIVFCVDFVIECSLVIQEFNIGRYVSTYTTPS